MHFLPINELLLTLALGAGLGFFGGLFGIGGGIIAIPLLVLGFGMEQPLAQGTALVLMVPNLLIGWWRYSQRHPLAWRHALLIGGAATLTTWLVAHFATRLEPQILRWLFSLFIGMLALRLLIRNHRRAEVGERPLQVSALPLVGMLGGGTMGLLGIGGGLVAIPVLTGWLGQRQTVAQSLSLALVVPSSIVAFDLCWGRAGRLVAGLAVGGRRFIHRLGGCGIGPSPAGKAHARRICLDAAGNGVLVINRAVVDTSAMSR